MSDAALSDLIRFSLLEHFGGTWIDATVLLTGKIPEYILESDFFAFRDTFGLIENPATISNWLLHSVPHNIIIKEAKIWLLRTGEMRNMLLIIYLHT